MNELEELEEGLDSLMDEDPEIEQEYMDLMDEKERRKKIQDLRDKLKEAKDVEDEDFAREMLRDVASQGRVVLEIISGQIESDPRDRSVEVVADLIDSMNNTLSNLLDLGIKKKKLELDERKIEQKEEQNKLGSGDTNILVVGSAKDLQGLIDDGQIPDDIEEAEAEIVEENG